MNSPRYQALVVGGVYDFQTGKIIHRHHPEWADYQRYLSTNIGGVLPPTALPAHLSFEALRDTISQQIKDHATTLKTRAAMGESFAEVAEWTVKAQEATIVLSYSDTTTNATLRRRAPFLFSEAQARGITVRALARRVLEKHSPYRDLLGQIARASEKHKRALDKMTDKRDLLVYDWLTDWPEI
ncbi:MAG: hypothetical protein FWC38_05990 [Proteobacteria bacterium]|nr:hypothetical protein [Pseudomonadota bacterium]MCL2307761.1 hypothetical protein [Pseudomonadota bacterium]